MSIIFYKKMFLYNNSLEKRELNNLIKNYKSYDIYFRLRFDSVNTTSTYLRLKICVL